MQASIPEFVDKEGLPVFIRARPEDIGNYVVLCVRDPLIFSEPAEVMFSRYLTGVKKVGDTGLVATYSGEYKGTTVTICFMGSGAPEMELAVAQFIQGYPQVNTLVRLGACGSFQPNIEPGVIAIATGAVRDEGSSREYVAASFPALASYEILLAQIEAAERIGAQYEVGIFRSNDTMYPGLGRSVKTYLQESHERIVKYWSKANVSFIDRETSLLLTLSSLFGLRGGSVCLVVDNYFTGEIVPASALKKDVDNLICVVFESLRLLKEWDERKKKSNKKWLTLSILGEG